MSLTFGIFVEKYGKEFLDFDSWIGKFFFFVLIFYKENGEVHLHPPIIPTRYFLEARTSLYHETGAIDRNTQAFKSPWLYLNFTSTHIHYRPLSHRSGLIQTKPKIPNPIHSRIRSNPDETSLNTVTKNRTRRYKFKRDLSKNPYFQTLFEKYLAKKIKRATRNDTDLNPLYLPPTDSRLCQKKKKSTFLEINKDTSQIKIGGKLEGSSARPPLALYIVVYSPSEDRANRTRSRPAECVCCIRAGGGEKTVAGHGGREEGGGIRASLAREKRGEAGWRTPRWSMNRGHTRRSRERNTACAPCTRVLRLYLVSRYYARCDPLMDRSDRSAWSWINATILLLFLFFVIFLVSRNRAGIVSFPSSLRGRG